MLRSREIRKEFIKRPDIEAKVLAKKYGVALPFVYKCRKQVKGGASGSVDTDGRYWGAGMGKVTSNTLLKVTSVKAPSATEVGYTLLNKGLSELVASRTIDYRVAYAMQLLGRGKVSEATSVLIEHE